MTVLYTNNASTTLVAGIDSVQTSFSVGAGEGVLFPNPDFAGAGEYFVIVVEDTGGNTEIMQVTARNTDIFTVVRAFDNSTARSFAAGSRVELRLTAHTQENLIQSTGDTMTGNLTFNDVVRLRLGTAADFRAYHDGTKTLFENYTGNLLIQQKDDSQEIRLQTNDSGSIARECVGMGGTTPYVRLNYNGVEVLRTSSTGVDITGALDVSTAITADTLDATDAATTRTNLDVYSKDEVDLVINSAPVGVQGNCLDIYKLLPERNLIRDIFDDAVRGISVSPDGTVAWVLFAPATQQVVEYKLWVPHDLRSAQETGNTLNLETSVTPNAASVTGMWTNSAGTHMFWSDNTNDEIRHHTFSTGWDISSANAVDTNKLTSFDATPLNCNVSEDGTKLLLFGGTADELRAYTMSTAWDLSSATYDNDNLTNTWFPGTSTTAVAFDRSGLHMYVNVYNTSTDNQFIYHYELATAWDITSTKTLEDYVDSRFPSLYDAEDGHNIYTVYPFCNDNGDVYIGGQSQTVNDAGLVTRLTQPNGAYTVGSAYSGLPMMCVEAIIGSADPIREIAIRPDGKRIFIINTANDTMHQVDLRRAWDITSWDYSTIGNSTSFMSTQTTIPYGFTFNPDGTKIFIVGGNEDAVFRYSLTTAWDITSTITYDTGQTTGALTTNTNPYKIRFNLDGTRMLLLDSATQFVDQYNLSTGWDLTTATYNATVDVTGSHSVTYSLHWSSNGHFMYISGANNRIGRYYCPTPFTAVGATDEELFCHNIPDYLNHTQGMATDPEGKWLIVGGFAECIIAIPTHVPIYTI